MLVLGGAQIQHVQSVCRLHTWKRVCAHCLQADNTCTRWNTYELLRIKLFDRAFDQFWVCTTVE